MTTALYVSIPSKVMSLNIRPVAKLVYGCLLAQTQGRTGKHYPDLGQVATLISKSENAVKPYLWELHHAGLIQIGLHVWRTTLMVPDA